ncbi:uncharacterized protein CLAFUR5_04186 [Fulvia fulva]|uniref:Uncharacterized protein n=1 Tax=Passalora fulva TaxID=5499 RepID=A0A9Q8LE35_PASFU|nr:uncharacterized protein CLAFUR5_04186 [Fulvia fulva]KAK4628365.1 hypothetical protein CLAFUR0_04208 [Fulvia fulva]UJO15731.1 hypothetical protein CLAFUR5_04186 [Fulvia fulva]
MADRNAGIKFVWSEELPYCALRSPACFWAMMLGADSQINNSRGVDANKDTLTLTLRHMTINSMNLRLPQMDGYCPDWGLMSLIAVLGCWEKFHGHEMAWKAHRDGLKVSTQRLRNEQMKNEVFAQVLTLVDNDGTLMPDLLGSDFWQASVPSGGFAQLAQSTWINTNLVISLRDCRAVELAQTEEVRERFLAAATGRILQFVVRHFIGEVACTDPFRDREGDRQVLTVHVIMQMAGMAMVHFLADEKKKPLGLALTDIQTMCHDAARLISSVMHGQIFEDTLLWAVFTVGALAGEDVEALVHIAVELFRRAKLDKTREWQPLLREFVFLESAMEQYEHFHNRVRRQASQLEQGAMQSFDN